MDYTTTVGYFIDEEGCVSEPKYLNDNTAVFKDYCDYPNVLVIDSKYELVENNYSKETCQQVYARLAEAIIQQGATIVGFLTVKTGILAIDSEMSHSFFTIQGDYTPQLIEDVSVYDCEDDEAMTYEYITNPYQYPEYFKYL